MHSKRYDNILAGLGRVSQMLLSNPMESGASGVAVEIEPNMWTKSGNTQGQTCAEIVSLALSYTQSSPGQ
jgi:hypothetical protein